MYSFLSILSYKNKDIITKGKKGQLELWKKLTMSGTYIAHSLALSSTASKHFLFFKFRQQENRIPSLLTHALCMKKHV